MNSFLASHDCFSLKLNQRDKIQKKTNKQKTDFPCYFQTYNYEQFNVPIKQYCIGFDRLKSAYKYEIKYEFYVNVNLNTRHEKIKK